MRRAAGALLAALGLAPSCNEHGVHLFVAFRYQPDQDCVEAAAAVDVIDGDDPGICEETRCWLSPANETYVSTAACDAPLDYTEVTSPLPGSSCAKALAAQAEERLCAGTGGAGGG